MSSLRFDVLDLRFKVPDLRCKVSDLMFEVPDSKFKVSDLRFKVSDLRSKVSDLKLKVSDLRSKVPNWRLQVSDLRSKVSDLRFKVSDLRPNSARAPTRALAKHKRCSWSCVAPSHSSSMRMPVLQQLLLMPVIPNCSVGSLHLVVRSNPKRIGEAFWHSCPPPYLAKIACSKTVHPDNDWGIHRRGRDAGHCTSCL